MGTYTATAKVADQIKLEANEIGSTIYYSLDGTEPLEDVSHEYSSVIQIPDRNDMIVKYFAVDQATNKEATNDLAVLVEKMAIKNLTVNINQSTVIKDVISIPNTNTFVSVGFKSGGGEYTNGYVWKTTDCITWNQDNNIARGIESISIQPDNTNMIWLAEFENGTIQNGIYNPSGQISWNVRAIAPLTKLSTILCSANKINGESYIVFMNRGEYRMIFYSRDSGVTFTEYHDYLQPLISSCELLCGINLPNVSDDTFLFAGRAGMPARAVATAVKINQSGNPTMGSIVYIDNVNLSYCYGIVQDVDNTIYACGFKMLVVAEYYGVIWKSTDNGGSWTVFYEDTSFMAFHDIIVTKSGNIVTAGHYGSIDSDRYGGVVVYNKATGTWTSPLRIPRDSSNNYNEIFAIAKSKDYIMLCGQQYSFLSPDEGLTWWDQTI